MSRPGTPGRATASDFPSFMTSPVSGLLQRVRRFGQRLDDATDFPLLPTIATLWQRFQQDRLGVTASSLTFTTVLALVPFFAVVLSIFTAFPVFGRMQDALQQWLTDSLIPASIAGNVLDYLTQFASKASQLGTVSFAMLFFTTLSLLLTIDQTLNGIWRVRRPRPLGQRLLVYWAALTLGPLVLGGSLLITSYLVSHSGVLLPRLPGGVGFLLHALQFLLLAGGMTLLYRFVPNTPVRWAHALAGGSVAAIGMVLTRLALGWYLARIPTYSLIYGTFATVPLLLLWLYISWMIVLVGAIVAAYLPVVTQGVARRGDGPGWDFTLAVEVLQAMAPTRGDPAHGLTQPQLADRLRVDTLQISPVMDTLEELGWVARLATQSDNEAPRYVLLADPARTPLAPLLERLLLAPADALTPLWEREGGWAAARIEDLWAAPPAPSVPAAASASAQDAVPGRA